MERRFWAKVQKTSGCWEWVAGRSGNNRYGVLKVGKQAVFAHRVSWQLHYGAIPLDMRVLHRCDNPICVRPDHLWLGTQLDNIRDRNAKGRTQRRPGESNHAAKLTESQVRTLRKRVAAGEAQAALARELGVSKSTVWQIIHAKKWQHAVYP